ncbi:MAG: hypothetical protein ACIAS6_12740 [Phycisphaerales bacterium JB060]
MRRDRGRAPAICGPFSAGAPQESAIVDLIRESWGYGLPQAAIALAFAGALGIAAAVILNRRGPKNRLASEGPAYAWAWLYVVVGMGLCLACGRAYLEANWSSTIGFAVAIGLFIAVLVTPLWYGQLTSLGAAASRLGVRSMHLMMAAMTLAGVAAAVATPLVITILTRLGLVSEGGDMIAVFLGTLPLGSAIAAISIAPFLPIGRYGKGRCMSCGYDLAGLPASTSSDGAVRCPECGYHPSQVANSAG